MFEFYPFVLRDEIVNRSDMDSKHFEEAELWYLLYCLLTAACACHADGRPLGDIRPLNVFISEDGQVKASTLFSWPGNKSAYDRAFAERETTYLAPELLKELQFSRHTSPNDHDKCEAFSIGLTLLDAILLSDGCALYRGYAKFDFELYSRQVGRIAQSSYSPTLKALARSLCCVEPAERMGCSELHQCLMEYEDSIVAL